MHIHKNQVTELLGVAHRTLEAWVAIGYFPKPFHMGRRAYWDAQTVKDWIADKSEGAGGVA